MQKTVTRTLHLMATMEPWRCKDGEKVAFYICSIGPIADQNNEFSIGTMEVSMYIPKYLSEHDLTDKFIEVMRAKQQDINAEAHLKVANIEEQIQSMLALPAPKED